MAKNMKNLSLNDFLAADRSGHESFVGIQRNAKAEAYADFLFQIRKEISEEMKRSGKRSVDIARDLGVSKSVVSRVMNPDSDLLASTMFELAWSLKKYWHLVLLDDRCGDIHPATLNMYVTDEEEAYDTGADEADFVIADGVDDLSRVA